MDVHGYIKQEDATESILIVLLLIQVMLGRALTSVTNKKTWSNKAIKCVFFYVCRPLWEVNVQKRNKAVLNKRRKHCMCTS